MAAAALVMRRHWALAALVLVAQLLSVSAGRSSSLRQLLTDTQDCFSLDCCEVQCQGPPTAATGYALPPKYCCPRGTQCRGDGSGGDCENIGGGGQFAALTLSDVTVNPVNQYTTGSTDPSAFPNANPCNFNGKIWYCPSTLNCGRTYLDCLPSDNFGSLANHGY